MYSRNCEVKDGVEFPSGMQRVALGVAYSGGDFRGFQRQSNTPATIQEALETALSTVANEPITVVCAGRTDAGVHASAQVLHFDTLASRQMVAWVRGVNTHLPPSIRVQWAQPVSPNFHARFSALSRTYRYLIVEGESAPPGCQSMLTCFRYTLDEHTMSRAAQALVGEHDFSSFRATQCQAKSPVRAITRLRLFREGALLVLEVSANAFLHHMVRNIVGSLVEVGRGARSEPWLAEVRDARDRTRAAATAPPNGLYLVAIDYPAQFAIPVAKEGPVFLKAPIGLM